MSGKLLVRDRLITTRAIMNAINLARNVNVNSQLNLQESS